MISSYYHIEFEKKIVVKLLTGIKRSWRPYNHRLDESDKHEDIHKFEIIMKNFPV